MVNESTNREIRELESCSFEPSVHIDFPFSRGCSITYWTAETEIWRFICVFYPPKYTMMQLSMQLQRIVQALKRVVWLCFPSANAVSPATNSTEQHRQQPQLCPAWRCAQLYCGTQIQRTPSACQHQRAKLRKSLREKKGLSA